MSVITFYSVVLNLSAFINPVSFPSRSSPDLNIPSTLLLPLFLFANAGYLYSFLLLLGKRPTDGHGLLPRKAS